MHQHWRLGGELVLGGDITATGLQVSIDRLQVQQLAQIHTFTDFCLTLSALGSYPQGVPKPSGGRRGAAGGEAIRAGAADGL